MSTFIFENLISEKIISSSWGLLNLLCVIEVYRYDLNLNIRVLCLEARYDILVVLGIGSVETNGRYLSALRRLCGSVSCC